ncbi:hypothetical protein HAX54_030343 [Datura stramonium]|uniref:Uncharacterized protein n=1 Tax=Datura stramonium TaxID=4076 RepID=A0ABS8RL14_DATST|nr:hypothetical protein [Datura stramonium]
MPGRLTQRKWQAKEGAPLLGSNGDYITFGTAALSDKDILSRCLGLGNYQSKNFSFGDKGVPKTVSIGFRPNGHVDGHGEVPHFGSGQQERHDSHVNPLAMEVDDLSGFSLRAEHQQIWRGDGSCYLGEDKFLEGSVLVSKYSFNLPGEPFN